MTKISRMGNNKRGYELDKPIIWAVILYHITLLLKNNKKKKKKFITHLCDSMN